MKKWLSLSLGIVTATGGFLDAGTVATAGAAGAVFGLGLVWAMLLATLAVILLVEMVGRFTAISKTTYAAAIREHLGFKFYLLPLASELIAESVLLAAELGGIAIAVSLVTGVSWRLLFPLAALLVWLLAWRASFSVIENGPALLGLVTLSFVAGIVALGGPRGDVLPTLWRPEVKAGQLADYLYLAAAILGATISPYLLYFYSSGAREEGWGRQSLFLNKVTAVLGMGFGAVGMLALTVLGAIVLRPLNLAAGTLGEIGLGMAQPFGVVGALLFAVALFATCLGASLEVLLGLSYNIAQGFGWEWGENKKPAQAARFNLTLTLVLLAAVGIGLVGGDPLRLALLGSTLIALFLPFSLSPILILMNDADYVRDKTNGRWSNLAIVAVLALAFVVALVSLPLEILSGGG